MMRRIEAYFPNNFQINPDINIKTIKRDIEINKVILPINIHFFPNSLSLFLKTKYINEAQTRFNDQSKNKPLINLFFHHIFASSILIFNNYIYKVD